ncbi:MAG TPA: hypothetical protein VFH63_02285 [candidate division Zixibacteria bacterium]|nr:hypothetical protein [candidate division Zixibacteria bacterium]
MTLEQEAQTPETGTETERAAEPGVGIQPAQTGAGRRSGPLVSVTGLLRGGDVALRNAVVGGAFAGEVEVERGFVRAAVAAREVEIEQGGAGIILSGGPTSIRQGGAQAIVSAGSVSVEQGGSGIVLARQVEVRRGGTVVFGIAPRLTVAEGGRVILGPLPSLIAAGTLAALAATVVAVLRRSGRPRRGPGPWRRLTA